MAFARPLENGGAVRDILRGMSEVGFAHCRKLSPANRRQLVLMLDTAGKRDRV
jgi:hypothetical protein